MPVLLHYKSSTAPIRRRHTPPRGSLRQWRFYAPQMQTIWRGLTDLKRDLWIEVLKPYCNAISTRRFFLRPSLVAFDEIGLARPMAWMTIL